MPNLEPLPAEIIDYHTSLEAEIAAVMLQLFNQDRDEAPFQIEPGKIITTHVSKRWDAPTQDRPEGGLALRMESVPSIAILEGRLSEEDARRFRVLLLEYGTIPEESDLGDETTDDLEDDEFDWHNYVLAVMDANDPEDCCVVNAETGAALDDEDLFKLRITLSQWMNDRLQENYLDAFSADILETPLHKGKPFVYQGNARFIAEAPIHYHLRRN